MATVSFNLPEKAWAGLNTRFRQESNYVDNDQFTAGTYNILTDFTGAIVKIQGGTQYASLSHTNSDQYEAIFTSGVRHLLEVENGTLKYSSGDGIFHTVTSGYTSTAFFEFALYNNRVYFGNGVDNPQSYDLATSYGGVTYTAPKTKDQGVIPPLTAPTFAADTNTGGAVPVGGHHYKVTFLYYDAQESNGGPASVLHTVSAPNQTVNLTGLPIGGYGVTARKIYRDDNDNNYTLVAVVSNNTATTTTDVVTIGTTPIPLDNGVPPIYSLITTHLDRLWVAGVSGNTSTLYWSEAGEPDIWSVFGFLTCNATDPITGLYVYNDRVMVFNKHSTGQILNRDSADFRYSEITPNIGCIDNRTIQIRTIRGLPTIIWLSEFGWYEFNGSSVNAISSEIDDQVQFNIQQGSSTKGSHTDTNQADFASGTASPGIDLDSFPGNITTFSPQREWELESDWEGGTSLVNVVTEDGSNTMSVPTAFSPALIDGTVTPDAQISGSNLVLPTIPNFTGDNHTGEAGGSNVQPSALTCFYAAQSFTPPVSGTITTFLMRFNGVGGATPSPTQWFYANDSGGFPNTVTTIGAGFFPPGAQTTLSLAVSIPVTAGVPIWIGVASASSFRVSSPSPLTSTINFVPGNAYFSATGAPLSWTALPNASGTIKNLLAGYTMVATPIANSGAWNSPVRDTASSTVSSGLSLSLTGSYPATTSVTVLVQGTNDDPSLVIPTWTTTDTLLSPTGTNSLTGSGFRYWQIIYNLATSDNRNTPSITAPVLTFNTTGTFISEVIDHTTDIVSLDNLSLVDVEPAGTTITLTIATSTDNITYSSFTPFGSAVAHRYSKVKVVMNTTGDNVTTPTVSSVILNWTLTSNLISAPIDTGTVPAGWDVFQDASTVNSGTISFFMRSATSSGGLGAQTFVAVTNGSFPTVPVHQWVQWKVIITNSTVNLAIVASVTINWFITITKGIRAASLFYKKRYYMSAAEFNQSTNNVVYVFDEFNTWKILRGITIGTLGLFFNEPYYGDAAVGRIVKWLFGNTNVDGSNISMDVRTKSFSALPSSDVGVGADEVMIRILRSVVIKVVGTGARITPTYSPDGGVTFFNMNLIDTGNVYYDTPNDGVLHTVRFSPLSADLPSTRSIMIRITNNDVFPVSITNMKVSCMTSRRQVLNG